MLLANCFLPKLLMEFSASRVDNEANKESIYAVPNFRWRIGEQEGGLQTSNNTNQVFKPSKEIGYKDINDNSLFQNLPKRDFQLVEEELPLSGAYKLSHLAEIWFLFVQSYLLTMNVPFQYFMTH
jgi:hypothetical protein